MSHYDGEIFQTLLQRDGLGSNIVVDILTAAYGSVWIATEGGATRYRPVTSPPKVRITDVVTDEHHGSVQALSIPSTLLAIHFEARSFKTHPANMQFVYRLRGHDETWHSTREHFVEYDGLDFGQYTFELRAIDRDLTYSTEAATVSIDVHPPYDQWALVGLVIVALAFAGVSGVYARRRRDIALTRELEEEVQTAREMQMRLMPEEHPDLPGYDVCGVCVPATQVGGDCFQYFSLREGSLGLCVADATGHAMQAAIPIVVFSGALQAEVHHQGSIMSLVTGLNRALVKIFELRTFVCLSVAELDIQKRSVRVSNAGCPYPCHYRAESGAIEEVELDAYPLAVREDIEYEVRDIQFASGDRLVMFSDGLVEAQAVTGKMRGFERVHEIIRQGCLAGLSSRALIDFITDQVHEFTGDRSSGDDLTCLVLHAL